MTVNRSDLKRTCDLTELSLLAKKADQAGLEVMEAVRSLEEVFVPEDVDNLRRLYKNFWDTSWAIDSLISKGLSTLTKLFDGLRLLMEHASILFTDGPGVDSPSEQAKELWHKEVSFLHRVRSTYSNELSWIEKKVWKLTDGNPFPEEVEKDDEK